MTDLGVAVVLTGEQAVKSGLAGIREETRKLMDATVGVSGSFKSAADSASAFTSGIRSLAEAENSLHVAAQNQITDLKAQKIALQDVDYQRAQREIKALNAELNPAKVQTFTQTWQELASKYYLVSQAAQVAGGVIMSLVDAASKYELIRARFNAAEGSKLLGARDMKEAQELAKAPGVGLEQVANTMATLRGMKVTASETKELIKGIGQANASAAGTAETFGRVMYQIQQSVSYGKLTMEDLKPIVQAIPTLGAAMQAHFGANQAEQLNDLLKKSGKSVREFWLEMAELGEKMPATGETIANNMDNMSDAWVRFRAALASTDTIKGATRAMGGLLEKIAEFLEKDQSLERSYIVRTRVVAQVQQDEQKKYGGAAPALPAGMNFGAVKTDSIMAGILEQGRVADSVKAATKGVAVETSLWAQAVGKTKLEIDALAASKEAADKRDRDAKKLADEPKRRGPSESKIQANVIRTGPNEVTMRGGMEWATDDPEGKKSPWYERITGGEEDQAKGLERREAGREKAEKKQVADAKKLHDEVQRISERNLADNQKLEANAHKIRMDWESALLEKKKAAHEEEMRLIRQGADVGQKLVADQAYTVLQGEFTKQGALNATKDVAFRAIADTTTKWIEEQILKMVFAKSAEAASTAASVAQATAVGSAWAAPSMAASIGTFGASTAAGSAAWFTAMTTAQGYGMMPHERGGAVFGAYRGNREERLEAFVPSRVVPIQNTTTHSTTNAQRITINIHGGDEKSILRTLRNAGINGSGVSRR